ncbi:TAXI family TRAP transporter solute-binding subunit, partial [Marinobacter alexandrii]
DNPVDILAYRYPVLTVRAGTDEQLVYSFIKALDETYGMYKDATAVMPRWRLSEAGTPAIDVPFHPGAIQYLQEKGIWTEEHQAWNDARTERLNALMAAWSDATAATEGKSDEVFAEIWEQHRQKALSSL